MKRVIFRGDDAAGTEGANLAIRQCVEDGILRNISIMAPGPALEHAAAELAGLADVAFGLHVTLNSEWEEVRWGPVLPATQVPSLVLTDGTFTGEPGDLHAQGFDLNEAMAEVAAQVARLREVGFRVDYLDEHMGVGWLPGLADLLCEFAAQEGLVYAGNYEYVNAPSSDLDALAAGILASNDDPIVAVFHPLPNVDPVARRFTRRGLMPGEVLRERAQDRRVLTDPRWSDWIRTGQLASITYVEAASG